MNMAHDYDRRSTPQTRTAEYKGEGQEFFELLEQEWNTVHYDADKGTGWAQAGSLGKIEFNESGNDPAVIVTIAKPIRMKGRPEDVMKALEQIAKAIDI